MVIRLLLAVTVLLSICSRCSADWEIRRNDADSARPPVVDGVVSVSVGDPLQHFPRYLNEVGVNKIRISFREAGDGKKKLSLVWTGGSMGPDKFAVSVDGVKIGESQTVDTAKRPYAWYRDEFVLKLGPGAEYLVEISSPEGFASSIEFAGIRLSDSTAEIYQPLCYESSATLEDYEKNLGAKGVLAKSPHVYVFAPHELSSEASELAAFLEKAYLAMKSIYGMDTLFKFSVEHYPEGHKRGWGGISGAGTIGYSTEALTRFAKLKTTDVRGFAGYTEEMSHGFKSYYACKGTYEALGVAVQEDVVRKLVSKDVADRFWTPEHQKWDETHKAYFAAGRKNPDPDKYPWNVLFTRILNDVFYQMRSEYGPDMWPHFFRTLVEMDYPLHRAKETERMKVYADAFTKLLKRDMRKEFTDMGIDLEADPPWGWETYKE